MFAFLSHTFDTCISGKGTGASPHVFTCSLVGTILFSAKIRPCRQSRHTQNMDTCTQEKVFSMTLLRGALTTPTCAQHVPLHIHVIAHDPCIRTTNFTYQIGAHKIRTIRVETCYSANSTYSRRSVKRHTFCPKEICNPNDYALLD
ncbi:hypothetical protein POVWA1_042210 [Plasmodium ovale wallikeri]|uniref:Uncharacterized protein n=1 Tax=Plasmodium ovale wallikeri TaxID=864142 RepID=A0A1A8Z9N1_PLAOA|nr:hypothetical protein POVWA1_042210 [Plasmodium ovale wallikeri]